MNWRQLEIVDHEMANVLTPDSISILPGAAVVFVGLMSFVVVANAQVSEHTQATRCDDQFEAAASAELPRYAEHQNLLYYHDNAGIKYPVKATPEWEIRRNHVLLGMQDVMGPVPRPEKRTPLDVRIVESTKVAALTRRKINYQSEPGDRVSAYLFLPNQTPDTIPDVSSSDHTARGPTAAAKPGRYPAVLCLQQTNRRGKLEPAGVEGDPNLAYALHLAQRGYVTLAPDYPGFGESQYDFSPRHGYASGTMKAVWDNLRAVDLLQSLPEVDPDRIGVIGHSLGGHNAMFTAAFEPRLRVIVSNCGFTRFHKDDVPSWTGPRYMPRIATSYQNDPDRVPFDFPEIVGSFAPRPFLAIAAKKDRDFDYRGVQDSISAARPVYKLFGREANLQAHYPDTDHAFLAEAREIAYQFLDRHLKTAVPQPVGCLKPLTVERNRGNRENRSE